MKRFEYKVLIEFSLSEDKQSAEEYSLDNDSHSKLGPDFKKGSMYVDYQIPDGNLEQCALTKKLLKKGYIKLVNTIE